MNETLALNVRQAGNALRAVYIRELAAYFLTPLAYVFIAIFLIALGSFTFEIGRFGPKPRGVRWRAPSDRLTRWLRLS